MLCLFVRTLVNVVEDKEEDLCKGINQWNGIEWNCFEAKRGQAMFTVDNCTDDIKVFGEYANGVSLDGGNYMTIKVNVTKVGVYSLSATVTNPDDDNGYFFLTTGEFFSLGEYTIVLTGMGTPNNFRTDEFTVSINGVRLNGVNPACTFNIKVKDNSIRPNYTLRCNTTKTRGVYKLNTELDGSNYIEVFLDVDPSAYGANFEIKTDVVDGIYFKASGTLTASMASNPIRLMGFGKPTSTGKKILTISTNSESDASTCRTLVDVALTKKTILSLGTYASTYGYCFGGSLTNTLGLSQSAKLVKTTANFGILENSIVKVDGIVVNNGVVGDNNPNAVALKTALDLMPDVVILGVYYTPDAAACLHFVDYLAKGGVLLAFLEFDGSLQINQTIFANKAITSTMINNGGAVYALPYDNDDVLNGPFGDIRGKQWGEDATATRAFSNIPTGSAFIYSTGDDMTQATSANTDKVTLFRHNSLNYIYCGDGGFNSGYSDFTYRLAYPFHVNESGNNVPIKRDSYGRGAPYFDVYNSIFTANAIAWGMKKAQERIDLAKAP